jgi:hypothetical protein
MAKTKDNLNHISTARKINSTLNTPRKRATGASSAKIESDQRYVIVLLRHERNLQTALRERDANGIIRDEIQNLKDPLCFQNIVKFSR